MTPTLACAAAKIGDVEALDAIKEMVRLSPDSLSWFQSAHLLSSISELSLSSLYGVSDYVYRANQIQ